VGVTPSMPVKANSGVRARVSAAGKVLEGDDKPTLLREDQHYLHYITIVLHSQYSKNQQSRALDVSMAHFLYMTPASAQSRYLSRAPRRLVLQHFDRYAVYITVTVFHSCFHWAQLDCCNATLSGLPS